MSLLNTGGLGEYKNKSKRKDIVVPFPSLVIILKILNKMPANKIQQMVFKKPVTS